MLHCLSLALEPLQGVPQGAHDLTPAVQWQDYLETELDVHSHSPSTWHLEGGPRVQDQLGIYEGLSKNQNTNRD